MRTIKVSEAEYAMLSELRKMLQVRTARQALVNASAVVKMLLAMQESDFFLFLTDGKNLLRVVMKNEFGELQAAITQADTQSASED